MVRKVLWIWLLVSYSASLYAGWWNFWWPWSDPPDQEVEAVFGVDAAQEHVQEATKLAALTRGQREESSPDISLAIWEILPDYSFDGAEDVLGPGIRAFVLDNLQVGSRAIVVERYVNPGDVSEGVSNAPVFFIREDSGRLLAVVKAYSIDPTNLGGFVRELSALDLLVSLALQECRPVRPLAVGRMVVAGEHFALLAFSAAPGRCLTQLIRRVGEKEPGSDKREKCFKVLCEAVAAYGRALAEMRVVETNPVGEIGQPFWDLDDWWFERFVRVLHQYHDLSELTAAEYDEFYTALKAVVRSMPQDACFVHADAHTGNYLYDGDSNTLTIIDTESFCKSIDREGRPHGPPDYDLIWGELFLDGLGIFYRLNEVEQSTINALFQKNYYSYPAVPPLNDLLLTYHRTVFWASTVAAYLRPSAGYTPEMEQQMRSFIAIAIDRLEADYHRLVPQILNTSQEIAAAL